MAARQFFPCRLPNGTNSVPNYIGLAGDGYNWITTAPVVSTTCRWAGSWSNFIFQHVSAPGSGNSFIYTLVKNGVDTAVVITIADLATEGRSTASVSAVSGDTFYWRRDPVSSPTVSNVRYISEFSHSADNFNGYHGFDELSSGTPLRAPLFDPNTWTTATHANNHCPVAAPGTLTELYYSLEAAPGSGKNYQFAIYINGTLQDGAGGTTDTRVTIADLATTGSWAGSIALAAGDYVTIEATPTGTPTVVDMSVAISYTTTVDGESNIAGRIGQNLPSSGTQYMYAAQGAGTSMSAVETDVDYIGGISDFELRDFHVRLTLTVGTGPITFTTRQNGASAGVAATLTTGQQSGSDLTNTVTISDGDTWSLEFTATGSPGVARIASQSWVLYALGAPAMKRVFIFGQGGKTVSTPTALFNLDGVARTVDLPKSFGLAGCLVLINQTVPPAAEAGMVFIWAQDNGAGKLQIMAQYPTGAAQQLFIEP